MDQIKELANLENVTSDSSIYYINKINILGKDLDKGNIIFVNEIEYNDKIIKTGKIYKIFSCMFENAKKPKIVYINSIIIYPSPTHFWISITVTHQKHSFSDFGSIYQKVDTKARRKSLKKWYKTNKQIPKEYRILQTPVFPGTLEVFSSDRFFKLNFQEYAPIYIKNQLKEQQSYQEKYKFIMWLINHKLKQYKHEGENMFEEFERKNKESFMRI